jgi:branched-chain amino acid transport system ATP-binding protein
MGALLRVEALRAGYGPIEVLKGVSLEVHEGEIVTLIGANGAGKTTTLMCLSGCNPARKGRVLLDGRPIHTLPAHSIVRLGVCQSPEGRKVFPRLTVRENLELGAYTRRDSAGIRADLTRVFEMFPVLGRRQGQAAGTLSGGEQQMLAIGRAMMGRPRLLLLDEPSLGLAPLIVVQIFDALRTLNAGGTAILLVEQNARMALRLAHRGYALTNGVITLSGPADELLRDPQVQEAYLGA